VSDGVKAESPDKENGQMMQVSHWSHLLLCRPQLLFIQYKIQAMLPHLAAETIENSETTAYSLCPFHAVEGNTTCKRCSLMVPSLQTGHAVCQETGWCEACTRVPPYVTVRKGDSMPNKSIKK